MKYVLNKLFTIFLYIVYIEALKFSSLALFSQKIMTKAGGLYIKKGWL